MIDLVPLFLATLSSKTRFIFFPGELSMAPKFHRPVNVKASSDLTQTSRGGKTSANIGNQEYCRP